MNQVNQSQKHSSGECSDSLISQEQGVQPTERPWYVGEKMEEGYALVIQDKPSTRWYKELDHVVCHFKFVKPEAEVKANAELIVRAVNAHDALVAASQRALWFLRTLNWDGEEAAMLTSALALADKPAGREV